MANIQAEGHRFDSRVKEMLGFIVGGLVAVLAFALFSKPDPMPINLIYSVPGKWYWLKFHLMKFVIARRQKKTKAETKKADDLMGSKFGGNGRRDVDDMENKHELPDDKERPVDAVFFDASNADGWYLTLGTAQRKDDVVNLFFVLRVPHVGTFVNTELYTDTNVESIPSSTEWATRSGFRIACEEPMRRWTLSFKGKWAKSPGLRYFSDIGAEPAKELETVDAEFELEWNNFGGHFDFDAEVSPTSIAHSLAIEPWSREMFKRLQDSHQTHYEQFGFLGGSFKIGGSEFKNVRMTSMRDHTIAGHRNWSDLRRYIMMIYHLSDGTCIHTSLISMPDTVFSHLEFGYVITSDKQKVAVDRIRLHLSDIGEGKNFPSVFRYSFDAGDLHYDVKVKIVETCSFKMGLDLACQVNENMAEFEANGLKGYGFAECEYRIAPY